MKTQFLKSGAPLHIMLGVQDLSVKELPVVAVQESVHRPLWFLKTAKGTEDKVLLSGADRINMYGGESFSLGSEHFNHQTLGMLVGGAQGSGSVTKRILGGGAAKARLRLWIDILAMAVPNYQRNSNGTFKTDGNGDKIVDTDNATIPGYKVRFYISSEADLDMGTATSIEGHMVDGLTKSMKYPIMDLMSDFKGDAYNNIGFTFTPLKPNELNVDDFIENGAMPFNVSIFERANAKSTGKQVKTITSALKFKTSWKKGYVNSLTRVIEDVGTIFPKQWNNTTDPLVNKKYSGIGESYIYHNYLDIVTKALNDAEADQALVTKEWADGKTESNAGWYDYQSVIRDDIKADEQYMLNLFTLKSGKGVAYTAVQKDTEVIALPTGVKDVNLTSKTPIYLEGGSNGVMTDASYEASIQEYMKEYLDVDSTVMVIPRNPETVIYDTGFKEIATKESLCNFISIRKNTVLFLSTEHVNDKNTFNSINDSKGVGNLLKARIALSLESEFFGTPSFRAVIMGQTGMLADDSYSYRVPLTFHAINKFAGYMASPKWNSGNDFESGDNSRVQVLKDIQPNFVSDSSKQILWRSQVVYCTPYDKTYEHIPGFQTVYTNDRSVLNNPFVAFGVVGIETAMDKAHRKFAGNSKLSEGEFLDAVVSFVEAELAGMFDGRFVIIPKAIVDSYDEALGYSWTLTVDMGANPQRTVQTSYITARRAADMVAA